MGGWLRLLGQNGWFTAMEILYFCFGLRIKQVGGNLDETKKRN
jgi:hypothetical protein